MSATLTPSPTTSGDRAATPSGTGQPAADLGTYRDRDGRDRALIARPGVGGSVLVIDQDAQTLTDRRLVAHLAADEPAVNARVVAELYLADALAAQRAGAGRPRLDDPARRTRAARRARATGTRGAARSARQGLSPGGGRPPPPRAPDAVAASQRAPARGDREPAHRRGRPGGLRAGAGADAGGATRPTRSSGVCNLTLPLSAAPYLCTSSASSSLWRWRVGVVGGGGRVRADAQPYLGPRSGVAPGRRHDG